MKRRIPAPAVGAIGAVLGAIMIVPASAQFGSIFNDIFAAASAVRGSEWQPAAKLARPRRAPSDARAATAGQSAAATATGRHPVAPLAAAIR
jgi:hypothetical protein